MPLLLILPPISFNPPPIIHTSLWCPIAIYSHVTDSLECSDKYSLSLIAWRRKGGGGAAEKGVEGREGEFFSLWRKLKTTGRQSCASTPAFPSFSQHLCDGVEGRQAWEVENDWGGGRGVGDRANCVGLHVSWPSVAGVSLALGKSESLSRLDMRSSSACTSPRPSLEPASHTCQH